jgi:hypothetical protein
MKVRNMFLAVLLGIGMITMFLLATAAFAVGQAKPRTPAPPIASTHIPFDFWIDDTHLAAGDYALYPVLRLNHTLLSLRDTKTGAQEEIFLVPTGDGVVRGGCKLVFLIRDGQHYLREVWDSDGKAILTSQYGLVIAPRDTRSEVPLVEEKSVNAAAAK